jgi:hypothetical protein
MSGIGVCSSLYVTCKLERMHKREHLRGNDDGTVSHDAGILQALLQKSLNNVIAAERITKCFKLSPAAAFDIVACRSGQSLL